MEEPSIRILQSGDEPELMAFLLPRLESSMFLVGNMRAVGLVDHGEPYEGTYAAAFERGEIIGVVAHYWNQNLVFQAPAYLDALWVAAVEGSGRSVQGLIGPGDQVHTVKEALDIDDSNVQMDETEKLYGLELEELVVPHNLNAGDVKGRRIEIQDLELITRWRVAYALEALGEEAGSQLQERCRASTERALKEKRTWVLEEQGKPVACSSFNTATKEAVQVGGVWTPPELRRQGYGRAVVAASLLDARAEGVEKAILFTGIENAAAQKAYEALGFRRIGSYRILLLKTPLEPIF